MLKFFKLLWFAVFGERPIVGEVWKCDGLPPKPIPKTVEIICAEKRFIGFDLLVDGVRACNPRGCSPMVFRYLYHK